MRGAVVYTALMSAPQESALVRVLREPAAHRVGRAAAAARGAGCRRRTRRVDRHLSCGPRPGAQRDVRVPHRQRRRRARGTQPAASRDQSRDGCAARSRGAVPDDQALARVLPVLRRARLARRVSVAGRARRRQVGRSAAMCQPRVGIARGDPRARAGAFTGRLGQSSRRSGGRKWAISPSRTSRPSFS